MRTHGRLLAALLLLALALGVGGTGVAWAHDDDSDKHSDARGPLDGTTCETEDGREGTVETSFDDPVEGRRLIFDPPTTAKNGAHNIRFVCQQGPPILTVNFSRGVFICCPAPPLSPSGEVRVIDPPRNDTCSTTTNNTPCTYKFRGDSRRVTLRAQPTNFATQFISWDGCVETSGAECVVVMNHSKGVTANFSYIPGYPGFPF